MRFSFMYVCASWGAMALDINNLQDADYQIIKRIIEYVKSH